MNTTRSSRLLRCGISLWELLFVIVVMLLCLSGSVIARKVVQGDSLEFRAFKEKLLPIFREKKIQSIISKLPSNCKIYGYDTGDISDDGAVDLILSERSDDNTRKQLSIHFFLNTGEEFALVQTIERTYISEPIEVGFSIDAGVCHVTQKLDDYRWEIVGYIFENQIFKRIDRWETQRKVESGGGTTIGYERMENYSRLQCVENYYRISDSKALVRHTSYSLPVLPRGWKCPSDIHDMIGDSSSHAIMQGSSSWFGPDDCSLFVTARYDSNRTEFSLSITDENILVSDESDRSDYVELWFDFGSRVSFLPSGNVRTDSTARLLGVSITMREQRHDPASPSLFAGSLLKIKAALAHEITYKFSRDENGTYHIILSMPTTLFRELSSYPDIGFTALYHDTDNPDHPDWVTISSTSDTFERQNALTFGRMIFLTADPVLYERDDLRSRAMTQLMNHSGLSY